MSYCKGVGLFLLAGMSICRALAFNTGPHFDMTRDAMSAEGFGDVSIRVVQVHNWFNDLYEQDTNNAYSGHVTWFGSFSGFIGNLLTLWRKEDWPDSIVNAAEKMHFDSSCPIDSTAQADAEWTRLARATKSLLQQCARNGDVEGMLAVMGMSLHAVQDFYTHSNWVEPKGVRQTQGYSGPGWAATGKYGSFPTWFDIPAADRNAQDIYSRKLGKPEATHGSWDSPTTGPDTNAMNKDAAARPFYREAYITALIATRQWIQAMRTWTANETMWQAAKIFANGHSGDLSHDMDGAFLLSWKVGAWNGNEGTRSGKVDIIRSGVNYFEGRGKTVFRRKWEALVRPLMVGNPQVSPTPVPRSGLTVSGLEFIEWNTEYVRQIGDIDGDIPLTGNNDADWYSKININGQWFTGSLIDGHNTFGFPKPYSPWRYIKSVPKVRTNVQPLWLLAVRLKTGSGDGAGSDMDLHLQLGSGRKIEFPYGDFDDFERNRNDTYWFSVPAGTTMKEFTNLSLVKSGGGGGHAWQLGGIEVAANGVTIYKNDAINRWFNARNETWALPGFRVPEWSTKEVPIRFELWDDDWGMTGGDDQADVSPAKHSKALRLFYDTATGKYRGDVTGFGTKRVVGAGESDTADISLRINTIKATPPPGGFKVPIRGDLPDIRPSSGAVRPPTTGGTRPPTGGGVRPPGGTRPPAGGTRPLPGGGTRPPTVRPPSGGGVLPPASGGGGASAVLPVQ